MNGWKGIRMCHDVFCRTHMRAGYWYPLFKERKTSTVLWTLYKCYCTVCVYLHTWILQESHYVSYLFYSLRHPSSSSRFSQNSIDPHMCSVLGKAAWDSLAWHRETEEMFSTWCKVVIKAQLEILTQKRQTTLLKQN